MQNKTALSAIAASILLAPFLASAATLSTQLSPGMSGDQVSALQTFLAADSNIYPEGIVNGLYGPLTTAAVRRYQSSVGLSPVGRVGPATLASINGTSGTDTSYQASAPSTKTVSVTPSTNSANISWQANEAVFGQVMYGTTWPFLYTTAPIVSTPSGLNDLQAATLTGLQSQTTYYFVLISTDAAGNLSYTIGNSFKTK